MDTNCIGYNVDVSGCSPEVIKAITQTLSRVKEDLQKVANTNKEENKKKETDKRWKPNLGENYFRIDPFDNITSFEWANDVFDNKYYNARNIYKTKEEAEFEVERRKIMIELQNYADEHNGEIANPSDAFWIAFDEDDMSITVEMKSYLPPVGTVLFSDADTAYDAIEAIGENRILEYMFRVNPKYMFRVNPNKELHCNGDCECCDEYNKWDDTEEDED